MKKVLCFGEVLLRLSPELQGRWLHSNTSTIFLGGAELNVAAALAKWNVPVKYCSAVPDNYLSYEIKSFIEEKNIDASALQFTGSRIGIYYLPQGLDMKNAGVIYDRAASSFAQLEPGDINWNELFENVSWFHFSAISPALSQQAAAVCKEALQEASSRNITISVDLNYRSKLWQYGKQPSKMMPSLVKYCDVIMGNIWAANTLLDIPVDQGIHAGTSNEAFLEHAMKTSQQISAKFEKAKTIANTFRFDHGSGIRYFATLFQQDTLYHSPELVTNQIVDKVGSGDCFMGGLIYGLFNNHSPQDVIDFSAAAAFAKLQEAGDVTNNDVTQVKQILQSHG